MDEKNQVWKEILLKNIKGEYFKNVKTIPKTPDALKKKYQIFEILIAETLANVYPDIKWEVTSGSKDDGIDISGIFSPKLQTPFVKEKIEQLILGQIKRRNKGYRFDHFRTDIDKMFDHYASNYTAKGKSLFQLLFIISTDNNNNVDNLKSDLANEFEHKKHLRFVANISSPINIIDATDIIRYWKINYGFIKKILEISRKP